ncbi:hypothetical protein WJX79_001484 [Trebouxia sp. C0005]
MLYTILRGYYHITWTYWANNLGVCMLLSKNLVACHTSCNFILAQPSLYLHREEPSPSPLLRTRLRGA